MSGSRWPRWVYESGTEPDYRFTFANERTFLAWIRTALALIAGGVAVDAIELSLAPQLQRIVSGVLVVLGMLCAAVAWLRWARAERAIRRREALPSLSLSALVALVLVGVAIVILVAVL